MTDEAEKREREDDRMRRTEELRRWVERRGRGAMTVLQKRTGLTFAAVSRLVKRKAAPSPRCAVLLEKATNDDVSTAQMLNLSSDEAA
jgi:hypoxanthine-guanine phosphoribosyltransferase